MRLQHVTRAATAVATMLLATAACKRSDAASVEHAEQAREDCSITVSGAKTGKYPCSDDREGMLTIKTNESLVGFSTPDAGPTVMIAIKFHGAPTAKTYRSSDPDASQGIWFRNGSEMWVAMGSKESPASGSYTLTLTSAKEHPLASDTKGYEVHGTLNATLQADPDTGAKGTITLVARF